MICATNIVCPTCEKVVPIVTGKRDSYLKAYRRSYSEKPNRDHSEKSGGILIGLMIVLFGDGVVVKDIRIFFENG